jgi:hypothetical protein
MIGCDLETVANIEAKLVVVVMVGWSVILTALLQTVVFMNTRVSVVGLFILFSHLFVHLGNLQTIKRERETVVISFDDPPGIAHQ